jgi:hypothetical protein
MRLLIAVCLALVLIAPVRAEPARLSDLANTQAVLHWMSTYRHNPDLASVPRAMKALSDQGAFNDPEHCGAPIGFLAGVLAAHPDDAERIIERTLTIRRDDRWIVVRAVAYSGLSNWKDLLRRYARDIPSRDVLIERYIEGKLPTLAQFTIPPEQSTLDRMREKLHLDKVLGEKPHKVELTPTGDVLDLLWGYYFATGSYGPVMHMVALLAWSQDHNDAERLAVGSMAKFTLASNAVRDEDLLAMLRQSRAARGQPTEIVSALKEVINAAETVDTGPVRRQALAAIAELRTKGPEYKRAASWWSYLGQTAIAGGCLAAAMAGQVEFGLPCVVGGASSSAVMNFLSNAP